MLANILMLLKANEINEQQLSVFYIGLNVISNYMNYKLTQNSNDRSRVKPIHFVFFTLFQNRVIINTFLLYFLPNSLDATKKKKKSHCAHFIQYQCTNHAKDITDIIPPSSSGCVLLILKHLLTLFTRPCLLSCHYGFKKNI